MHSYFSKLNNKCHVQLHNEPHILTYVYMLITENAQI